MGIGHSQHAGKVVVADGTDDTARRLERVLWNDPETSVMRHADAAPETDGIVAIVQPQDEISPAE